MTKLKKKYKWSYPPPKFTEQPPPKLLSQKEEVYRMEDSGGRTYVKDLPEFDFLEIEYESRNLGYGEYEDHNYIVFYKELPEIENPDYQKLMNRWQARKDKSEADWAEYNEEQEEKAAAKKERDEEWDREEYKRLKKKYEGV